MTKGDVLKIFGRSHYRDERWHEYWVHPRRNGLRIHETVLGLTDTYRRLLPGTPERERLTLAYYAMRWRKDHQGAVVILHDGRLEVAVHLQLVPDLPPGMWELIRDSAVQCSPWAADPGRPVRALRYWASQGAWLLPAVPANPPGNR
jgi:hypothetical protein